VAKVTRAACVLVVAWGSAFAGAARADDDFRETPEAVQTIYRDGAPHTTRQGIVRLTYDAAESFFPIGIYNALLDAGAGPGNFALYASTGFNSVFPWPVQDYAAVMDAARVNALQVVVRDPTDSSLPRFANDPIVLGYELDHEPSMHSQAETALWRLEAFRDRLAVVRGFDPRRPIFTVNAPSITPPHRNSWLAYAEAGDLICFWKYPFFKAPVRTMVQPRSLPEVASLAAEVSYERKPVWYVAQAFRSPINNWFMPSEDQANAMIYAGVIHGATGIIWFAQDSYGGRVPKLLGASPDPPRAYPVPAGEGGAAKPIPVTEQDLESSRRMWRAIERLNGELAALGPVILSPTSRRDYRVAVRGTSASPTPIRTLLKDGPEGPVLLVVNIDADAVTARFTFGEPLAALEPAFGGAPAPTVADGVWTEQIEAWGVRVYRLR